MAYTKLRNQEKFLAENRNLGERPINYRDCDTVGIGRSKVGCKRENEKDNG